MIQEIITYRCRKCNSVHIVKNGTNKCGSPQYHCKECGAYGVLKPKQQYKKEKKETILRAYKERASMRGLERIFYVARQTVSRWIEKYVRSLPPLIDTLLPANTNDVLELDEVWSFVFKKRQKRWLWTAICRRTRQIVAFVIGDHSEKTCRRLWHKIPADYKHCQTFSDFWETYKKVFPKETHHSVGKDTGETAHMERWYNTLRQRIGRFVRKTLAFSKSDKFHKLVTNWYITEYNIKISLTN